MAAKTKTKQPGRIKSALLSWLGVPIDLTSGKFWATYSGAGSSSGVVVTPEKALQLSTVWACVRLLAETIATLPLNFFERVDGDDRVLAKKHPLYEILHNQPNSDMTATQFWEAVVASMLLWGNAFGEIHRSAGRVVSVDFLLPQRVAVKRLPDGSIEYRYSGLDGKQRVIDESSMFHIPAFTLDGVMGVSPIRAGAEVFGSAMATEQAAAKTFRNGMLQTIYYTIEQWLKPDQRAEFKKNLAGSIERGEAPLLEGNMDVKSLGINPTDAQLLESRAFGVEEVCRWFRVPPFMVGHSEKSTSWGTGIEQQMIGFLSFAIRPWLTRIEQAVRKNLLTPVERLRYFAEFSVEGLLRADSAGRAALYASAGQNGWMTRAEIRKKENLPYIPGSDELTAQSNLLPLHLLGVDGAKTEAAKSAFREWLGIAPEENRDAP